MLIVKTFKNLAKDLFRSFFNSNDLHSFFNQICKMKDL